MCSQGWEWGPAPEVLKSVGPSTAPTSLQNSCVSLPSCSVMSDSATPWTSLPGCSVHEILQARILEWVPMLSSRRFSWPRDQTHVSLCFLHWQVGSLSPNHQGNPNNKFINKIKQWFCYNKVCCGSLEVLLCLDLSLKEFLHILFQKWLY